MELFELRSIKKNNYEELIVDIIKRGLVLDHSKSPCEENFIPDKKGEIIIMFIKMEESKDFVMWLQFEVITRVCGDCT
ncbi:protein O-linked-mannose beta-1,2-N-acetylglucosaminyltransferase 1-like [Cryptotermes secundus]|uniref:protein O-linked-mannose beta-1,2-N-acetylglucosaminyltransferase 1-like n=1 Tax=Cryptotermes secundus TaxID=105785 RepID=UPI000CD7CF83|nr:protein O-linked-mannose beta-1,2-N-acetylglucosaminyltransferase 1-like [Cryptotermes secundus]